MVRLNTCLKVMQCVHDTCDDVFRLPGPSSIGLTESVVLDSLTENKGGQVAYSCDQRRAGSSQDKVSITGKLQHKLPAPPQTSDFRGDH